MKQLLIFLQLLCSASVSAQDVIVKKQLLLVRNGAKIMLTFLSLIFIVPINAQVMWNLKGGISQRKHYYVGGTGNMIKRYEDEHHRLEWMAGLEMEIPLSNRLNIETGLRYRNYESLVIPEDTYGYDIRETTTHFELPLRLAYKQPLGRHFSLHAGIGPYASYAMGDDFGERWDNNLQVGLEPSVAINWACLSLGATYNIPCFYKGYKDENKPVVMATLGIRFKSSAWKYVGATLLTIATVGGAAASAWSNAVEANRSYSSGDYGSSSYSGGSSSRSSASSKNVNHGNWTALERSYSGDESLLIKMRSSGNYDKQEVRRIQERMKRTRELIEKQTGHKRAVSDVENWVP